VTSSEELEELARDMPAPIASTPLGRFADAFPELAELSGGPELAPKLVAALWKRGYPHIDVGEDNRRA
jgi:hypothetical protein